MIPNDSKDINSLSKLDLKIANLHENVKLSPFMIPIYKHRIVIRRR
jgi:hypothetical protein